MPFLSEIHADLTSFLSTVHLFTELPYRRGMNASLTSPVVGFFGKEWIRVCSQRSSSWMLCFGLARLHPTCPFWCSECLKSQWLCHLWKRHFHITSLRFCTILYKLQTVYSCIAGIEDCSCCCMSAHEVVSKSLMVLMCVRMNKFSLWRKLTSFNHRRRLTTKIQIRSSIFNCTVLSKRCFLLFCKIK